jgi:hypothetical protein
MRYQEFATDQFVAGQIDLKYNWSLLDWLFPCCLQTTLGAKALYGPLSDNNNPLLHPALNAFHPAVGALGKTPYIEVNIGMNNILQFFRLEWVQRLTYLERDANGKRLSQGALFISSSKYF